MAQGFESDCDLHVGVLGKKAAANCDAKLSHFSKEERIGCYLKLRHRIRKGGIVQETKARRKGWDPFYTPFDGICLDFCVVGL